MRIGIVNDLKMAQEIIRQVIAPKHEVCWIAADGEEAINFCASDLPDLVLMDLIMPGIDGVAATKEIMDKTPCPILVVTATVDGNVSLVFNAMSAGALDAVNTPAWEDGKLSGADELIRKISSIAKVIGTKRNFTTTIMQNLPEIVLIGASTGGPAVISEILSSLPADFHAAIIIAQHVDNSFIEDFSIWLSKHCKLPCEIAHAGLKPERGHVYIAKSDEHIYINRSGKIDYTDHPKEYPYQPSINILFESFAQNWTKAGVAILLTGMGEDGASGMLKLKDSGWDTVAQDEASSVVYGMPKKAMQIGAAKHILPVSQIIHKIINYYK